MCVSKVIQSEILNEKLIERTKNTSYNNKMDESSDNIKYKEDLLAIFTYYTKIVLFFIGDTHKRFLHSTSYKILFHTTQPAHVITALAVICIAFLIFPNDTNKIQQYRSSPFVNLLYLGSFCAHFGAQIWMTFVSGLALYFSLPRHAFGNVQKVLFPKYFLLNSALSFITLLTFINMKNSCLHTVEISVQTIGMSVCFMTELIIRLYFTPPLLKLITIKNEIEESAGVGMEIGKINPGSLLNCSKYLKIHKSFRKVHMSIAIGNMITIACTILHLYYLSCKL